MSPELLSFLIFLFCFLTISLSIILFAIFIYLGIDIRKTTRRKVRSRKVIKKDCYCCKHHLTSNCPGSCNCFTVKDKTYFIPREDQPYDLN